MTSAGGGRDVEGLLDQLQTQLCLKLQRRERRQKASRGRRKLGVGKVGGGRRGENGG